MAALLHDIGHLPFSHTLEDEHVILRKHDRPERLERTLNRLKGELASEDARKLVDAATPIVRAISDKDAKLDWKSDLVGNTVCADLLAYITTDAEWTGIEKRPGHYRVYDYFEVFNNRLCIRLTKGGLRPDVVSAVMDLLDMRYALTERVLFHHAKCVASAMLGRAARLAGLSDIHEERLMEFGDERFVDFLRNLASRDEEKSNAVGRLLTGLFSRHLYKRIFKVGPDARRVHDQSRSKDSFCDWWRDGAKVEETLRQIESSLNLPCGTLVVWCPEELAGMKEVKARVIWETATGMHEDIALREIGEDKAPQFAAIVKRVQTIEEQYNDLWTFWVAAHRDHLDKAADIVEKLEKATGIECDPVFRDTYLVTKVPAFEKRASVLRAVRDGTNGVQREVADRLMGEAAREGGQPVDPAIVEQTAATVYTERAAAREEKAKKGGTKRKTEAPGRKTETQRRMIQDIQENPPQDA
jgi:HD superfamily phosphohydrolase